MRDGEKAGLIEGRLFGLEKSFEKFVELGRIQGRVSVWKGRIPQEGTTPPAPITNPRLIKHIQQLDNIVSNPSTTNDEEGVEEVDDALKRGKAKAKIVASMLGEKEVGNSSGEGSNGGSAGAEPSIEDGTFNRNVRI